MLSFETRVNGRLINYMHVTNIGTDKNGKDKYTVRYFRPEENPPILEFKVKHQREKGAESLVLLIHKEVLKHLKK